MRRRYAVHANVVILKESRLVINLHVPCVRKLFTSADDQSRIYHHTLFDPSLYDM